MSALDLLEELSESHMVVIRQGDELHDGLTLAVCSIQYMERGWHIYKGGSLASLIARAYGGGHCEAHADWNGVSP